ncbi:hypothetical protein Tco_0898593 [Tanacetum coccineum]
MTQQHEQTVQKEQEEQTAFTSYWKILIVDDDDDEYTIQYRKYLENSSNAIAPVLPIEEPDNSLSMGDKHLSTIPEMESDEVIKSSVKEVKDDILREKLLNINLLIAKIESLNDNSTPDCVFKSPIPVKDSDSFFEKSDTSLSYSDNSLPKFETFSNHTEETSSGSTTTHADNSLPEYDSFLFEIKPDQGELTSIVREDILGEPRVHMPNDDELFFLRHRLRYDRLPIPSSDNSSPLDVLNDHFEIFSDFNNDCTSSDDDSFEEIDYVEASLPDSELVSLEEVKDDILHENLLNINLLIACDLPSSDDFSPISIFEEKFMTFSNPLFDSNDDFTSNDDESLSDEDVPDDNFKFYSNPLFDEELEDTECKDSYDSNLDESNLLVTPLFDSNEDECLAPSDDIKLLLQHDPFISVVSILEGFTDEPPLEENDNLVDLESKENDWKKILYDSPIDDLITKDKVFDPGIHELIFSPTYVNLSFVDHHYLSFTYVIRTFLCYFTYPVNSPFPLSFGSEDIIFDPDISAFHFSSLKPVAYECPIEVCSSTCFIPNITMI